MLCMSSDHTASEAINCFVAVHKDTLQPFESLMSHTLCAPPLLPPLLPLGPLLLQFLSLLQNGMLQDMLILYTAERKTITMLRLGEPVCGHPTIVHGERAVLCHRPKCCLVAVTQVL